MKNQVLNSTSIIYLATTAIIILIILTSPLQCFAQENKKNIVVIPKATLFNFWKIVCTGAISAAKDNNVNLIWRGSRVENQIDAQKHLIDFYVNKKVDAIVIAPTHATKLDENLARAKKAGIKIVVIDSNSIKTASNVSIATDNYELGRQGAELLLTKVNKKGPLLLLGNVPHSDSVSLRAQGFINAVGELNPQRTVISINLLEGTRREAKAVATEILNRTRNIAGIFAVSEVPTEAVLYALEKFIKHKIPFIGVDYSEKLIAGLNNGKIDTLITQKPYEMGYLGVKSALDLINGNEVPREMESPVRILSKKNPSYKQQLKCLKNLTKKYRKKYPICFE